MRAAPVVLRFKHLGIDLWASDAMAIANALYFVYIDRYNYPFPVSVSDVRLGRKTRREAGFSFRVIAMRTIVYIDGYNLYYSLLRGSPHKWLDLLALFRDQILAAQEPSAQIVKLKFFTSPAKAKFAAHGRDSVTAQNEYHRALLAKHGNIVEVINGFHETLAAPMLRHREPPDRSDRVKVWHLEEKQTDVNLALHIYRDAVHGDVDLQVICSNDSDAEPSLAMVRRDAPAINIGLVVPLPPNDKSRRPNARLVELADWVRHVIRPEELAAAQLPDVVPTNRKAARRPAHW